MTPFIPGLTSKKMSSSSESDKIDLTDSEALVLKKIKNADCVAGNPDNGIMAFLKHVVFILKGDNKQKLEIQRPDKFGGNVSYKTYQELEKDFISKKLHPLDVKLALAKEVNALLAPMRKEKALIKLHKEAFP